MYPYSSYLDLLVPIGGQVYDDRGRIRLLIVDKPENNPPFDVFVKFDGKVQQLSLLPHFGGWSSHYICFRDMATKFHMGPKNAYSHNRVYTVQHGGPCP